MIPNGSVTARENHVWKNRFTWKREKYMRFWNLMGKFLEICRKVGNMGFWAKERSLALDKMSRRETDVNNVFGKIERKFGRDERFRNLEKG